MPVPWSEMSAEEVFDSLSAAPRKVASRWMDAVVLGGVERTPACRRNPSGTIVVWERAGLVTIHSWAVPTASTTSLFFHGRAAADAWLRQNGWILVDEAQDGSS